MCGPVIGWLYVAVILDVFSRLVVGWAMSQHNDEQLVRQALEMALSRRAPPTEMLLHSDQGSPYTSTGYLQRLAELGIVVSMSRVGDCYDNAAMESFWSHPQRRVCGAPHVSHPARGAFGHFRV